MAEISLPAACRTPRTGYRIATAAIGLFLTASLLWVDTVSRGRTADVGHEGTAVRRCLARLDSQPSRTAAQGLRDCLEAARLGFP